MEKVKLFTLGGNDEDGKNIIVIEIDDEIYVVDAGVSYPRGQELLGVEVSIPDFSYLIENKNRVKGIFITHGHDDVMGALSYLLKEINATVYTTPLTALMVEDALRKSGLKKFKIKQIKRDDKFKIGNRHIITFGLTHSIPDTFGIAIDTKHGYIVHSTEFVIDSDVQNDQFSTDIGEIAGLGKKGVYVLTMESVRASHEGFTSPKHRISEKVENAFENANKRIITTLYDQNVYRLIEVLDLAYHYKRKVYFHNSDTKKLLEHLSKLNYYRLPAGFEINDSRFDNDMDDVVIIVSGTGPSVFTAMHKISMGEDDKVALRSKDTVIIASPIVPGTEVEAGAMENELYKEDVKVLSLNYKQVSSMHASKEDIKLMINLLKPKYYIPVKGEYLDLVTNANIAFDMGLLAKDIIVLDNGQIASFENGEFKDSKKFIRLEDVLIDGKEHLDTSGLVLRDRQTLATDGVVIAGVVINFFNKKVVGGPDIQSRGVIYLKDAENIMKEVGNILINIIESAVKDGSYDNVAARTEARDLISKYIFKETGKRPMILPVIIEIKEKENNE